MMEYKVESVIQTQTNVVYWGTRKLNKAQGKQWNLIMERVCSGEQIAKGKDQG